MPRVCHDRSLQLSNQDMCHGNIDPGPIKIHPQLDRKCNPGLIEIVVPHRLPMGSQSGIGASTIHLYTILFARILKFVLYGINCVVHVQITSSLKHPSKQTLLMDSRLDPSPHTILASQVSISWSLDGAYRSWVQHHILLSTNRIAWFRCFFDFGPLCKPTHFKTPSKITPRERDT